MNRSCASERGFVSRSVLLAIVMITLLGIAIIDGSSILFAKWQLDDVANAAAVDAAAAYKTTHSEQAARDAVMGVLADRSPGAEIKKLTVDPRTDVVKLTLVKDTPTLFISRIGPLKHFAHVEATSTAEPTPA